MRPGSPEGELDCIYCSGLHLPPGALGDNCAGPAPAPGPGETTFIYCFRRPFRYLLASNSCLLVDPHATTLVPRGRRIRKACGHFRRPQKPLFERTEYPKSHSIRLFWTLNRLHASTLAPLRAGEVEKCGPSEPARANRTSRVFQGVTVPAPASRPLEFFY